MESDKEIAAMSSIAGVLDSLGEEAAVARVRTMGGSEIWSRQHDATY